MNGDRQLNTGILLVQMGTPDRPDAPSVRRYLSEFLSDKRIVNIPRIIWKPILHGIILRRRPKKSAAMYAKIWRKEGSPLLYYSERQKELLSRKLETAHVALGMRYGNPSLESAIDALLSAGVSRVVVFPLYPQAAGATTGSIHDVLSIRARRQAPRLSFIGPFFSAPEYVAAATAIIKDAIAEEQPQKLIFSYHGLPKTAPDVREYCEMCEKTSELLRLSLGTLGKDALHAYQSRFGWGEWTNPYLREMLVELARDGVSHVAVAFPGFAADCLETLYEVGMEYSALFKEAGGKKLSLVPCLNDHPLWIEAMRGIVERSANCSHQTF